ncbi:1599_t:CDS:2 [Dentiscutata heterogama]|uniref:1599_t:CDS:1 n=1 Tax=Dentiscutata heterogama TaxID=1316150 RepID=A0ACA9MRY3_9GLOM|nr:1599_t:CDS:2 [Dentiscutata heterogama]
MSVNMNEEESVDYYENLARKKGLRVQAYITQGIKVIDDYDLSNYNGTEYANKHDDKSIRVGIGIKLCLKTFKLHNELKAIIPEFIKKYDIGRKNDNEKYDIILFQFSNFLFYYLKNIFEHSIKKRISSGFDIGFDHTKADEATNIKWIGYACRDKHPKDINHSRKRPVPIDNDGIYSITNNYAFKFDKNIAEKKILLVTDASYPFISEFGGFKINVLFYDFKNPFDFFLNDVMDELVSSEQF